MTARYNTLTVVLEHDIREDDAEGLIRAIGYMRGVISVAGNVADPTAWMAEVRAQNELREKLIKVLYPKLKDAQ